VCCVCFEAEDSEGDDMLVYCDGSCGVAVHPKCCGAPLTNHIPEDEWICDKCISGDNDRSDKSCVLCGKEDGLLKRTSDGRWAHLACALWVPEAFFLEPDYREPIDVLRIPEFRWGMRCELCGEERGACLECSDPNCSQSFHAMCAIRGKLWMQYKTCKNRPDVIFALCAQHSSKWRRECTQKGIPYE
jgi:NuA3 HAT complex component NTO1